MAAQSESARLEVLSCGQAHLFELAGSIALERAQLFEPAFTQLAWLTERSRGLVRSIVGGLPLVERAQKVLYLFIQVIGPEMPELLDRRPANPQVQPHCRCEHRGPVAPQPREQSICRVNGGTGPAQTLLIEG